MSTIELTTSQRGVLELAVATEGRVENYPAALVGGARTSVMRGLLRNELVEPHDAGYRLTVAGYAAAGAEPPVGTDSAATDAHAAPELVDPASPGMPAEPAPPKPKRAPRGDTKLATVLGMLTRPEGATIAQIMAATEWQQHSVRGFLAGTVKKKGYTVTNSKEGDGDRVYRILTEEARDTSADAPARGDEEE